MSKMSSYRGQNNGGGDEMINGHYTRSQLEETKAFNAGLTRAGNKARPTRGRGGAANRSNGPSPRRASPPRAAGGAGPGGLVARFAAGNRGVTRAPPIFKTTSPAKTHGSISEGSRPGPVVSIGPYSVGPLNSATSAFVTPTPPAATTSEQTAKNFGSDMPLYDNGHNFPVPATMATPSATIPNHDAYVAPPPVRQLIVTNWTEDDPSKPWIPAHLHQFSAAKAIEEISEMIKIPFDELTPDGFSITRPREGVVYKPYTAPEPAPTQPSVDPTGWFMTATIRSAGDPAPQGHARVPSVGAMDVDIDEGHSANTAATGAWTPAPPPTPTRGGTLADSKWATPSWNLGPEGKKENVRPTDRQSTTAPSASGPSGSNWSRGNVPAWQTASPQFSASVSTASAPAPKQEKKLKDSRWAN